VLNQLVYYQTTCEFVIGFLIDIILLKPLILMTIEWLNNYYFTILL